MFDAAVEPSRIAGCRGSARSERFPRARGPNSMRPWNQATIRPSANNDAARNSGSGTRCPGKPPTRQGGVDRLVVELTAQEGRQARAVAVRGRRAVPGYPARGLERRADGRSGIVGCGVDVDRLERPVAFQPAVGDTVQRDSAAIGQAGLAGRPLQPAGQRQQGILGPPLQRGRDIGEAGVRGRFVRLTPSSKQRFQARHVAGAEAGQIEIDHDR